ncbi:cellulose synthase A catalytic subunit 1 [Artemisia annua]|uniref:Cellulose synthase A catalytic subunit 1 n=1 Tax=Artemisia annua TaxID=35608 RepID=A0A2U1L2Y1_ARTAN|nr:cellulose synthase A catalytic subunit 1 [Artemisia annua]
MNKMMVLIHLESYLCFIGDDVERSLLMSQKSFTKRFGQCPLLRGAIVTETTNAAALLKEAINVISCNYEDETEWGEEVNIVFNAHKTTTKLHIHRLILKRPAGGTFRGSKMGDLRNGSKWGCLNRQLRPNSLAWSFNGSYLEYAGR